MEWIVLMENNRRDTEIRNVGCADVPRDISGAAAHPATAAGSDCDTKGALTPRQQTTAENHRIRSCSSMTRMTSK